MSCRTRSSRSQGLLLGLFFMSVGMGVNMPAMAAIWPAVLADGAGDRDREDGGGVRRRAPQWLGRCPAQRSSGFLLSQGSEFTLVVVGIASISGAMPGELGERHHRGGGA